jgi:predicted enzyme related to lactoylglutathione lyase
MPDPFESLRLPGNPVAPDPGFTTRLRALVERALALPEGVTVSTLSVEDLTSPQAVTGVVPYLIVNDARHALEWYTEGLGARRRGEPIVMADGRVGHAELELRGGVFYLADESPESDVAAPDPGEAARVSLTAEVLDVDATADRAVRAGATLERAPVDSPHGRNAVIRDPFGHRWILSATAAAPAAVGAASEGPRVGDIGYVSLWVPDVARAASFFGSVLGWTYGPGSGEQGRQVPGTTPHHGLWGDQERSNLFLCFFVDDVDTAVARVRGAGGQADEPQTAPYGRVANCVDDQGVAFAVFTPPAGPLGARGPLNGAGHGDVSYVTLEVRDSAKARAFYGSVLGWAFSHGRIEDGWEPVDVVPMSGMSGGHEQATTVPMYRVDDIHTAVARVRAAGGEATVPERQPYGWSSTCVDDQGTRFSLGQL